jgi:hypothetical protein
VRMLIRLLSCLVIASAAITIWTRAALVFVLGPELTTACLWIAAGGSMCAVIALVRTRTPNRPQPHRPPEPPPVRPQPYRSPEPPPAHVVRGDRDRAGWR